MSDRLKRLGGLSLQDLRAEWSTSFGGAPPKLRTRELLRLAFAYRLQAVAEGDLSGALRRRLDELGRRFAEDRNFTPGPPVVLKPGSSIIKAWRGVRHEILITETGFSYRGEPFGSLSEVAQRITGTKWNGHVFFGLKARNR